MSATVAPTLYTRVTRSATRAAEAAALASASVPKTLSSSDENETVSQHQADTLAATDMPQASIDQTPNTTNVSSLLSSSSAPDRSTAAAAATTFTSPPPPTTKPRQKRKAKSSALDQPGSVGEVIAGETKPSRKRAKKRKDSGIALEDDTTKALEQQQQQQQQETPALLNLAPELFANILSYLYPSEIAKLAMVSKQMYKLVERQPIWRRIMTIGNLPEPKIKFPTEMIVVLAYSDLVCEQCLSLSEMKRGMKYSKRPLPMDLAWNPYHHPIRLCLPCRKTYYADHKSELGLIGKGTQILKGDAEYTYQLTTDTLFSLHHETHVARRRFKQVYYLFDEAQVQRLAYRVHGGQVGVEASRQGYVKPRHQKPRPGITPRVRKPTPLKAPDPILSVQDLLRAEIRAPGEEAGGSSGGSTSASTGTNINNNNSSSSNGDSQSGQLMVVQIGGDRPAEPVAGLPLEIWQDILSRLYLRDLVRLAQVSRAFQKLVEGLPVWKTIWGMSSLPALTKMAKTYMAMVCRYGESICEFCDTYSYPRRDALADCPLPILMKEEYSATRKVWACLLCRCEFSRPDGGWENDSDSGASYERINKREAMEYYALPRDELWDVESCGRDRYSERGGPVFYEEDVRAHALEYHGGNVGLQCALSGGYGKPRRQRPKPHV
ncbi:hypothetical protein DFQ27_004105 [Actinomortierella ambigua]|uniref:F-box domain-containing protein n=1 Tax=Actinomortierella ambigua TaxID=1343610 RepID=A0A9P6Q5Y6_9FUNG|nr:hypothetical protein DFQ27_004105 [Actinomortierella ambigua]